ncbi:MAG: hypothetical protein O9283_12685 [Sphingomonadaceae bacterium]|nr:hypothetical protein [Sphingomonadaceae bacterium]
MSDSGTETGLSRRSALTAAGVGLILAACDKAGPDGDKNAAKALGTALGRPEPYGFDPHSAEQEKTVREALGLSAFKPDFITLVRVYSDGAWQFGANHAAIAAAADPVAQAIAILAKTVRPGNGRRKFRDFGPDSNANDKENFHKRAKVEPLGQVDFDDFESFGFGSRHEIFVHYDSPRVTLQEGNLISFSPYLNDGKPAAPNDSFFVRTVDTGGRLKGPLIAIRNYFAKVDTGGKILPRDAAVDKATLALNLHFTLPGKLPMPMILDPTTGNGMGGEP